MFSKIKATNFLSWKELEFTFKPGITLLTGWNHQDGNSEGSGKSSIPNALTWGLFGCVPKAVNLEDVIHTGQKSCQVVITLTDNTEIIRTRKPNELYIKNSDGTIVKGTDAKDTQKLIENLIGMSFETFCQSIYSPQNYQNKFITANEEQKAKILSELQDLSIFDRASKKSNETLRTSKEDLAKFETNLIHQSSMLKLYLEQFTTFCTLSDSFDNDKLVQLDNIIERGDALGSQLKEVEAEQLSLHSIDSVTDRYKALETTQGFLNECNNKLYLIEQLKLQKANAIVSKKCYACNQTLPDYCGDDIQVPDNKELLTQKLLLEEELNMTGIELTSLLNKKALSDRLVERKEGLIAQCRQLNKEVSRIESMNNPYLAKIEEFNGKTETAKRIIEQLGHRITQKTNEISHLQFLKEGFKEIKSYVFQGLLNELNNKTNTYLKELFDITAHISFGNVSEEGDISKIVTTVVLDGYERSLGLLSGGQFRRVQLAVDFALADIVAERAKNPINIRILDEVMKDLSEGSQSKVVDILQRMGGSTVVIEHNSLIKNIVNEIYHIEYKDGVSTHANS